MATFWLSFMVVAFLLPDSVPANESGSSQVPNDRWPVQKTEAEWKAQLTPEQYQVLRKAGTERPHSSSCLAIKEDGEYRCVGCDNLLFASGEKFDSKTGWPSFTDPVPGSIATASDNSHGMRRVEVLCSQCGGHLGHVFDDGPPPTGKRYCINGVILKFVPASE